MKRIYRFVSIGSLLMVMMLLTAACTSTGSVDPASLTPAQQEAVQTALPAVGTAVPGTMAGRGLNHYDAPASSTGMQPIDPAVMSAIEDDQIYGVNGVPTPHPLAVSNQSGDTVQAGQ